MQADREKVNRMVKTARGQLDGVLKMIDEDRYCIDIANQLLASEALLRKAVEEVLRAHMLGCVQSACCCGDQETQKQKIDEVVAVLDRVLK